MNDDAAPINEIDPEIDPAFNSSFIERLFALIKKFFLKVFGIFSFVL